MTDATEAMPKIREAYPRRVLLTTERKSPVQGDVRIVDSDSNNIIIERFKGESWQHEGYYGHVPGACRGALHLVAKKGFPGAESVVESVEKCTIALVGSLAKQEVGQ